MGCGCKEKTPPPKIGVRPCSCGNVRGKPYTLDQCRRCWKWKYEPSYRAHFEGRLLVVNLAAAGLGDALLGLMAVKGLRAQCQCKHIVYRVNAGTMPFVRLFDGGYHELRHHDSREAVASDLQMNPGYDHECQSRAETPRLMRYCRNIGCEHPILPPLRDRRRLLDMGAQYRDCICLAPFSTGSDRNWPLMHWLTLERQLAERGHRVIVLDHTEPRCAKFRSEKLIRDPAEKVVAAMLNSALFIGNDSGLTHLSGILGRPTIVLSGPSAGEKIFGFYPDMIYLNGHLPCNGCWWQHPHNEACNPHCPSLATITPEEVLAAVDRITQQLLIAGLYPERTLIAPDRLRTLNRCVRETRHIPGAMAEVGVYRGGSAKLIASACPDKTLHLFDTFTGIPEDDVDPSGRHRQGDFAAAEADARNYLSGLNVSFHVGRFPDTATPEERYSFVHFDGDTYQAAKDALAYFWPRLSAAGVMVLDDWKWPHCPGVERAARECGLAERVEVLTPHQGILRKT